MIRHEFVPDEAAVSIHQVTADRSTLAVEFRDDNDEWQTVLPEPLASYDELGRTLVRTVPHLAIDALADWYLSRMALRTATSQARGNNDD